MADIENVIKGLEFTKAMMTFNPSTGEEIEPGNLNEANKTSYDACVGAIALLKEQEARVLTIEEALVDNNNSIEISPYVFVEIKGRDDIFIGSVHDDIYGDYHSNDIKVRVYRIGMSDSKTYPKADYMKTVRFWNRKPTDEQRQAVKWNE